MSPCCGNGEVPDSFVPEKDDPWAKNMSYLLRRKWLPGRFAAVFLLRAAAAFACTVCDSETGRQVRSGIFEHEFGRTLLAVLAPLLVILGVLGVLHYRIFPRTDR